MSRNSLLEVSKSILEDKGPKEWYGGCGKCSTVYAVSAVNVLPSGDPDMMYLSGGCCGKSVRMTKVAPDTQHKGVILE